VQWNESSVSFLMMSTEMQWNFFSVSSTSTLIFMTNDVHQILLSPVECRIAHPYNKNGSVINTYKFVVIIIIIVVIST